MKSPIENIRHSIAHLLAAAVLEIYPDAKRAIGPAIENGFYYDFEFSKPVSDSDLQKIEKKMREILKSWETFERIELKSNEAKMLYKNNPYKLELIDEIESKKEPITVYYSGPKDSVPTKQELLTTNYSLPTTCFLDLCKGGHVKSAKEISADAFKLTHTAGAYWRGDEKNKMLTRIYGLAFETKKELDDYLAMMEEAKKRDHRILGTQLKLFTFANEVGPGLPLWLPKGTAVRDAIEDYAKQVERDWGYQRVATPHIAKEDLYKMSGHIPYYAESMYPPMELDDGNYYLKAMNCPHTHMIYKSQIHSYRELPIRYAEYGTVYRHELSGVLSGLLRVRGFTQNDAHIYCTEEQAEEEFLKVMKLHEFWYTEVFGLKDYYMRLSLPAEDKTKYAGLPKGWKKSVEIIRRAMKKSKLPFVEAVDEAAFYGPKVDFQIKSVTGREETASTNQLDFLAADRFDLKYIDNDGKEKPIFVIHRAPLGSHERFIAFLIEHFAGAFPLWLAPVQVAVLPLNDKLVKYAKEVVENCKLKIENLRVELDDRNESVGRKIREAERAKIPYMLIIGEKEKKSGEVSVRSRGQKDLGSMKLDKFIKKLEKEIENKN